MDSERGLLSWIIVGTLAGWVATMIVGIAQEHGWDEVELENIVVGIIGAFVGGFLFSQLTGREPCSPGTSAASSWPSSGRWWCSSSCTSSGAPEAIRSPNDPDGGECCWRINSGLGDSAGCTRRVIRGGSNCEY